MLNSFAFTACLQVLTSHMSSFMTCACLLRMHDGCILQNH